MNELRGPFGFRWLALVGLTSVLGAPACDSKSSDGIPAYLPSADGGGAANGAHVSSSTSSGSTSGGGGAGNSGGSTGGNGGSDEPGDTPAPRPLNVTATKERHSHSFRTSEADPTVKVGGEINDVNETAVVDPRAAKLMGKLVLPLGGVGSTAGGLGGSGGFAAKRGFHVFGVAYFADYNILIDDPDFYGDARKEAFDGISHTTQGDFANIDLTKADGIEQRLAMGLKHLQGLYPEEDWGYYLNADGSVRWSDVIITGFSHGASSAARIAMLRRFSRAVSFSGPRDNTCSDDPACPNGVIATWFSETPLTPIERFYAVTGTEDGQHAQHLFAMEKIGYLGDVVEVTTSEPPYDDTHRLQIAGANHGDYCGNDEYKDLCNYLFNVPPENQDGVR